MSKIVRQLIAVLKKQAEPSYKKDQQWFFKEGINLYGVRIGSVRRTGRDFYRQIESQDKKHIFELGEELLAVGKQETLVVAFQWVQRQEKSFEPSDFNLLEKWLKKYVNNWGACDDLCTGPLGTLLTQYPKLIKKTHSWRRSPRRWVRRAAAVALIIPVRSSNCLTEVFAASDALMGDKDDLVRKGYGWLLKEASNKYPEQVFKYVMKRKQLMPRVALRYAIEKMPAAKKLLAMR